MCRRPICSLPQKPDAYQEMSASYPPCYFGDEGPRYAVHDKKTSSTASQGKAIRGGVSSSSSSRCSYQSDAFCAVSWKGGGDGLTSILSFLGTYAIIYLLPFIHPLCRFQASTSKAGLLSAAVAAFYYGLTVLASRVYEDRLDVYVEVLDDERLVLLTPNNPAFVASEAEGAVKKYRFLMRCPKYLLYFCVSRLACNIRVRSCGQWRRPNYTAHPADLNVTQFGPLFTPSAS